MQVSVIVPVYNAAGFVAQAAESALQQPETGEVVLVEDGSPDNSLEVCRSLAERHDRVRVLQHPGGANRGASASRNLGMKNARCPHIAFLDADDYFLPGRFKVAADVLDTNAECDGVHEAVGIRYQDEHGRQRWLESFMADEQMTKMTGMTRFVPPRELFDTLMTDDSGHIHLDGLVIRRSLLVRSGPMNENLGSMHEDTDFVLRLAAVGRLMPGRANEPVAVRRVHAENRIAAPRSRRRRFSDRMRCWMETYRWGRETHLGHVQMVMMNRMVRETVSGNRFGRVSGEIVPRAALRLVQLAAWLFRYPALVFDTQFWASLRDLVRAAAASLKGRKGPCRAGYAVDSEQGRTGGERIPHRSRTSAPSSPPAGGPPP